jgi:glutamyl-tRNA reductase
MVIIDLAVPRDVEAEVGSLADAYLYTVDDLAGWVEAGQSQREAAARDADTIVEAGVHDFIDWVDQRSVVPLIKALHDQADEWRQAEIARARRAIAGGKPVEEALDALSRRLVHKMLHGSLTELHLAPAAGRADLRTTLARLFLPAP